MCFYWESSGLYLGWFLLFFFVCWCVICFVFPGGCFVHFLVLLYISNLPLIERDLYIHGIPP